MTDSEQREAGRQFTNKWRGGGDEKQDCHSFWIELLQNVLGVENVTDYIAFEKPVKLPEGDGKVHTRYIDGYIPAVKVLIEQKGSSHPLDVPEPQSGGEMLTPYQQAKRYNDNLPLSEKARWIVTCNFTDLWIYDMEQTVPAPKKVETVDLQTKYPLLDFLVKKEIKELSHEMEVSIKAGDIVGLIYDAFLKQYGIPETAPKGETDAEKVKREHKLRSLNALCVRLVFCLYAEDAPNLFVRHQFHDYLERFEPRDCRRALIELFKTLDTPLDQRDEYLEDDLKAFPYVNGGLFSDESIEIPQFTQEIKDLLLKKASEDFDWRDISPTIFGAVFESTMNPETRRAGGLHYTSVENIHKVIDPLFLDDLKAEFEEIKKITQPRTKRKKLDEYQKKLASLEFLDPACGSGNFLTETFISLRRQENLVLAEKEHDQMSFASEELNPIEVSIQQFYGIEINDFAVTVAKTALWIAESQMLEETRSILFGYNPKFFPLKTYANITEGNALRIDWNDVVDKNKLTYIMGNPPFVGTKMMSRRQKEDTELILKGWKNYGTLDYVSCWYKKAADFIDKTKIRCAFVSTNSITQGEQVTPLWKPLFTELGIHIDFAYRTFQWDSEATIKAHVHCVIIGFSQAKNEKKRILFDGNEKKVVTEINPYLVEGATVFIESQKKPISAIAPIMYIGCEMKDDGFYTLSLEEKNEIIKQNPGIEEFIHPYYMGKDLIDRKPRYCFWFKNMDPEKIKKYPILCERIKAVKQFRLSCPSPDTNRYAEFPTLPVRLRYYSEDRNTEALAIPKVSSQNRRYIPMEVIPANAIAGSKLFLVPTVGKFDFGVLTSNVHMAWVRAICGRLKSDYSYSSNMVYNTFPWPLPTVDQKNRIEMTAQAILDARNLYPNSTLASLYDPLTMPPELRKAHTANDIAVMKAYGLSTKMSEADCVAALMEMYQKLVEEKDRKGRKQ